MTDATLRFSTRIGLLLSVLGIAVGTGNIWRFPRIVASNAGDQGGGAFLIAWVVFLLLWSIPLIVAEYAMGRYARMAPPGAVGKIAGKSMGWMGSFVALVATAIMFYYAVVGGWCLYYMSHVAFSGLPASQFEAQATWDGLQAGYTPLWLLAVMVGLSGWVISKGVRSIESVSRILLPLLLAIVLISFFRAITLPGAGAGIAFFFTPDWATLLEPRVWLEALTQNAWDTGAGWGLILCYAAYMRTSDNIVKSAFITGIGNNIVSLISGVTIFATVFALLGAAMPKAEVLTLMQTSGPASTGLTFIWLPQLFASLGGAGRFLAFLFFLGLSVAAFTSLLSMVELSSRVLVDAGIPRSRAVWMISLLGFALGAPSALSIDFLGNQDFVWGVALMISGAFLSLTILKHGLREFRMMTLEDDTDFKAGRTWEFLVGVAVPVQALVLLVWWGWRATTSDFTAAWWNPLEPYSLMSCLMQWGLGMIFVMGINRWLMHRTLRGRAWS